MNGPDIVPGQRWSSITTHILQHVAEDMNLQLHWKREKISRMHDLRIFF